MEQKWEAKVSSRVEKAKAEQIWSLFHDFFGLHKWFPGLRTCYGIHGANGQPGSIRYCSGFKLEPQDENAKESNTTTSINWSKEQLTSIDHSRMMLTYEIVESNIGFESYVSTVKVVPDEKGCVVEWTVSVNPVAGWEMEDLVEKYRAGLRLMVKKMEAAIVAADDA